MKNLKFINKIIKTDETGRSMVEMLGVLAIVGVISIGGIAGYIYGMNRYRTNEILDGGTKRAVLVASQLASEITPNLTEFVDYDETAGGTFSPDVIRWENEFGIQVSGVKKEVCENLIRMIGDNTPLRGLVNVDGEDEEDLNPGECADGTNNNLYLVYNLEMLSNRAVDSGSRSGPLTLQDPVNCSNNSQCNSDEECAEGIGICYPKCPMGTQRHDTSCAIVVSSLDGQNCGYDADWNFRCTCPSGYYVADESQCCPNGYTFDGGYCNQPVAVCTNGTWSASGTAYCVDGQWKTKGSFFCGDTNNPWSCRSNANRYACEPFGRCSCFDESETYPGCTTQSCYENGC